MSADILDRVYDAYTGEMGQQFMRETQRRIHWMCASVVGDRLLDVGCSQGLVPILLGREGKTVVGIDNSPGAVRSAEQHLAGEAASVRKLVEFVEGDFATQGFNGALFDCVLMGEVLEHLVHPERFVALAAERLVPGGRLVVTVPFGINDHVDHKHTFYLLEPYRLLATHFDVVEVVLLGKWLGLVGAKRSPDAAAASALWDDERLRTLEDAFNRIERDLVDDLSVVRAKLDDANAKYRSSTEDIARLKREVAHHESERKNADRGRTQAEADLSLARQGAEAAGTTKTLELSQELGQERSARHAQDVQLARLEERLNHAAQLRQLELEVRDVEIARLGRARGQAEEETQKLAQRLELERSTAAQEAERLRTSLEVLSAQRADLSLRQERGEQALAALSATLTEERATHTAERAALADTRSSLLQERAGHAAEQAAHARAITAFAEERATLSQQLDDKSRRLAELMGQLDALGRDLAGSSERAASLTAELASTRAALLESESRATELSQQNARLAQQQVEHAAALRKAPQHERAVDQQQQALVEQALLAQQRDFGQVLERQRALQRTAESKADQLRGELETAQRSARKLKAQLDVEQRERSAAERRAVQARNTLSYQLGYELIHGFKSRSSLLALPKSLWQLQQEAVRRRQARANKHQVPVRPLARAAEPAAVPQPISKPVAPANAPDPRPSSSTRPLSVQGNVGAPRVLRSLRVACIHDEFTFSSFAPECQLLQLSPSNWQRELEDFQPQLLFVESAWRGKDDAWARKIAHRSQELTEIVEWCRARRLPTAFWNKEDPVHYRTFLNTAKMFDHVFTTDVDCIPRYKHALGHDRVYLLPFALQPKSHNPLEKYPRKDAIAFAGAYYARYPERQADLATFVESLSGSPGLEIFDRNHGKSDPDYQFPEQYRKHIVGTLAFDEIDKAYKGYRYALNLNSIKGSQSMFARRVYELLGSNTITISNFSRGVRLMFGDLVITTDHGERALAKLQGLSRDDAHSRRFRLAGLRKVLQEHTYEHRLQDIASRVWGQPPQSSQPQVCVVSFVTTDAEAKSVLASFERQRYSAKQLLLFIGGATSVATAARRNGAECIIATEASRSTFSELAPRATHFAAMASDDYYGEHYLTDLALATRYSSAQVLGKVARYVSTAQGEVSLREDGSQYRSAARLKARAALAHRGVLRDTLAGPWLKALAEQMFTQVDCVATDEFNYCEGGARLDQHQLHEVADLSWIDEGVSLGRMLSAAHESKHVAPSFVPQQPQLDAARLAGLFKPGPGKAIAISVAGAQLLVESSLADETHEYLYAKEAWAPSELGLPDSGKLHFEATPGLNVQLGVMFLDSKKQRLGHKLCQPGANETLKMPDGTTFVQLALRIYGAGTSKLGSVLLSHVNEAPDLLFGRGDYLLITNRYPSDQDLYRNGFVHRRVLEYRKRGLKVDVFRMAAGQKLAYYEFDDVDVISGGNEALDALLRSNPYKAILVHFLDARMWQSIAPWLGKKQLLVWAHGAEIQAWHRREAHFGSPAQLAAAQADSEPRKAFWRNVLSELPDGSKLVFVSRHFANEVLSDLEMQLAEARYEVIHNVIDTSLFSYVAKPAEQRKRVLSIRPYTSRIYANDLAVAAILALRDRPCFAEMDFHLIGDGPLFDETVAPLRGLPNVRIDRRFLNQREIAALHREYGVFLCPSRGDTQGVSRDEAMSSGLVPITNKAGAIPEFVDEQTGMLVEREDVLGLSAAMERLSEEPELFLRLSREAAQRVRRQSGPAQTTERELKLLLAAGNGLKPDQSRRS